MSAPVRIPDETRESLLQLKLQVAAKVGRDITMGEIISLSVEIAKRHNAELVTLARENK